MPDFEEEEEEEEGLAFIWVIRGLNIRRTIASLGYLGDERKEWVRMKYFRFFDKGSHKS